MSLNSSGLTSPDSPQQYMYDSQPQAHNYAHAQANFAHGAAPRYPPQYAGPTAAPFDRPGAAEAFDGFDHLQPPYINYRPPQATPQYSPPSAQVSAPAPGPAHAQAMDMERDPEGQEDPYDDRDRKSAEGNYWNANEDEEDKGEYRYGGYHAVYIGEVFNKRFKVVKKLGWGEFSTVWLAWDLRDEQFVALKISKSAADFRKASTWEIRIFEKTNEKLKGTPDEHTQKGLNKDGWNCPDSQCVVRMYDHFDHTGENGCHLVMVFEVLGPNLLSLISAHEFSGIEINIVKAITKQVLKGLAFIHEVVKIIHTDLKPENILMNQPSESVSTAIADHVKKLNEQDPSKNYDHLLPMKDKDLSGMGYQERLAYTYGITISDLGAARWLNKEYPPAVIQTREYRSPEVLLGNPKIGTEIDIWSLACIVFELITGDFLFDPKVEKTMDKDVYHLALFMQILGDIPKHIACGPGKHCHKFFTKKGEFRHKCKLQPCQLSAVFLHNYGLSERDALELASFLEPMLEYDPSKRITAREALKHPWLEIREPD